MSRQLCNFDQMCLCVNNYRGEDYNKPNTIVECEDCIFNPKNKGKKKDPSDSDKVIQSEEVLKYRKTLQKGINLLKNNPNDILDIIKVATRLSYLRGRLFEQSQNKYAPAISGGNAENDDSSLESRYDSKNSDNSRPTKQTVQTGSGDILDESGICSASDVKVKTGDIDPLTNPELDSVSRIDGGRYIVNLNDIIGLFKNRKVFHFDKNKRERIIFELNKRFRKDS